MSAVSFNMGSRQITFGMHEGHVSPGARQGRIYMLPDGSGSPRMAVKCR
jgi:hypothetical protein